MTERRGKPVPTGDFLFLTYLCVTDCSHVVGGHRNEVRRLERKRGILRISYAKKSVSENGVCIHHSCNYRSCLCFLQHLCCKWRFTSTGCGNNQCPCSRKNNRRNLHVRPRYAGLVCSSGWILFCLFYGICLRKPAFIPSCLQKLWPENHTSGSFWNSHNLCNCRPNVHSIAASRLAQNAPLEHFAGLQPSLPRFLQWAWLRPSFTILTTMDFRFMSLLFSGCDSCALIFLLPSLPSCFLFSPLCELSSSWFLQETLKTERIFSSPFLHQN